MKRGRARGVLFANAFAWMAACAAESRPASSLAPLGQDALATDETVADMMPSGRTGPIRIPLRARPATTALRVTPIDPPQNEPWCFQLEEVVDGHGVELVARADNRLEWGRTCSACAQRVSVGHGFGWFVLPNDGIEHDFGDHLDLVISTRDCATLLPIEASFGPGPPPRVRVRSLAFAPKQGSVALDLFAATTADSGLGPDAESWLARVVQLAAGYFPPGAPALVLRASARLGPGPDRMRFGDGEQAALDEMHRAARTVAGARGLGDSPLAYVLFAGCLEHVAMDGRTAEIEGFATRIPGGGGDGSFADGVFVRSSSCAAGAPVATPERAAKILAHELGHFLGLYHTVEPSGARDLLADTDSHNLMNHQSEAADSTGLSPQQVLVMRAHPYVYGASHGLAIHDGEAP